ncbi:unnamed protein product [Adineta ricciae]|nr:unnamed protein product [Adineta ricciae]
MSATDNWIKLYRWWQEHLKSRFNSSSTSHTNELSRRSLLQRRSSLMSFRSSNNPKLIKLKKRASFGGIEQHEHVTNDGFRHVRDSVRHRNSRSTTTTPAGNHKRSVN